MANERLTGAFIKIFKVVDPDGANTRTLIGLTQDDVEIGTDPVTAETRAHNEEVTATKPLAWSQSITFSGIVTTELQAMRDLGLITGAGPARKLRGFAAATLDAIEIEIYNFKGDAAPKHTIRGRNCEVMGNGISYGQEDFATWECEVHVNGDLEVVDGA